MCRWGVWNKTRPDCDWLLLHNPPPLADCEKSNCACLHPRAVNFYQNIRSWNWYQWPAEVGMFLKSWNCHCKARLKLKFMLSTKSYIRCESKIGCSSSKLCLKGLCLELILSAKLDMWGDDIYQNICLVHWKYSFSKIWRFFFLFRLWFIITIKHGCSDYEAAHCSGGSQHCSRVPSFSDLEGTIRWN